MASLEIYRAFIGAPIVIQPAVSYSLSFFSRARACGARVYIMTSREKKRAYIICMYISMSSNREFNGRPCAHDNALSLLFCDYIRDAPDLVFHRTGSAGKL